MLGRLSHVGQRGVRISRAILRNEIKTSQNRLLTRVAFLVDCFFTTMGQVMGSLQERSEAGDDRRMEAGGKLTPLGVCRLWLVSTPPVAALGCAQRNLLRHRLT